MFIKRAVIFLIVLGTAAVMGCFAYAFMVEVLRHGFGMSSDRAANIGQAAGVFVFIAWGTVFGSRIK